MSSNGSKFISELKYKLLKVIDIAGLGFLSPVVRLCYGEEPAVQLQLIFQMIIVPLVAIGLFVGAWFVVADKVQTKSGTLPNPKETAHAYKSIMTMHDREKAKKNAYELEGEKREDIHHKAVERLTQLEPMAIAASQNIATVEAAFEQETAVLVEPLNKKYQEAKSRFKIAKTLRKDELKIMAGELIPGDHAQHDAYLNKIAANNALVQTETATLRVMKVQMRDIRNKKSSVVAAARKQQTVIAEEKQYLSKIIDNVTTANRSIKVSTAETAIAAKIDDFYTLTGPEAYAAALKLTKGSTRLGKMKQSEYAKPWTLPSQIVRSVSCVFAGFLIGSLIAIPIGIMCGLSNTFMAAMTPFIAIFKPVSPIVWLPIALIIVGGFIPDPDKNALIQGMWNAPLIGWMKINPAFIASAITVALCSLWPTLVNTALGVASIDKDYINVARVLKLGFWSRLVKIVIPSALPLIFVGLRISLGVGWMVLIAAELLASSEGLGKFVWDQFNNGASDSFAKMVVVIFVVGVIGLLLDRIMIVFQRLVSFDGSPSAI